MNGPRITNDERGFTVNKLGGVIALCTFILTAGSLFYTVSSKFAIMGSAIENLSAALESQSLERGQYRRDVDARIRTLETTRAADDQRISNMIQLLSRIDTRLERLERDIRGTAP